MQMACDKISQVLCYKKGLHATLVIYKSGQFLK